MAEPPLAAQSAGRRQRFAPSLEPPPPHSRTTSSSSIAAFRLDLEAICSAIDYLKYFLAGKINLRTIVAAEQTAIPVLEAAQTLPPA